MGEDFVYAVVYPHEIGDLFFGEAGMVVVDMLECRTSNVYQCFGYLGEVVDYLHIEVSRIDMIFF